MQRDESEGAVSVIGMHQEVRGGEQDGGNSFSEGGMQREAQDRVGGRERERGEEMKSGREMGKQREVEALWVVCG